MWMSPQCYPYDVWEDPSSLGWLLKKENIMRARDYIEVTKYEDINRGIAQTNYASLAGMLVATVKWGAQSIEASRTPFALEILKQGLTEKEKVENVVERYNRRFNVKHKEV